MREGRGELSLSYELFSRPGGTYLDCGADIWTKFKSGLNIKGGLFPENIIELYEEFHHDCDPYGKKCFSFEPEIDQKK